MKEIPTICNHEFRFFASSTKIEKCTCVINSVKSVYFQYHAYQHYLCNRCGKTTTIATIR